MNIPGVAPPWLTGFSDFNATALEDALEQRRNVATMTKKRSPGGRGARAIAMGGVRGLGCVITGACGVVTLDMEDEEEEDDGDDDDPEGGGGGGRAQVTVAAATGAMQLEEEDVRPCFSHLPVLLSSSLDTCCYPHSLHISMHSLLICCAHCRMTLVNKMPRGPRCRRPWRTSSKAC